MSESEHPSSASAEAVPQASQREEGEERAVEASRDDFRRLASLTPDLASIITFDRDVLWRNPAYERLLGSEAATTRVIGASLYAGDKERWHEAFDRLTHGAEEIVGEELRMRGVDGVYKWYSWLFQADHGARRIYCVGRESTSKKRVEDALGRSEEQLRVLIDRAPDFILVTTDDRVVYANAAAMTTLGDVRGDELLGTTASDLVCVEDRAAFVDLSTAFSAAPTGVRLLRSDDSFASVEVSAVRVEFDGAPSILYIARDLSERKRLEQQLFQADRMAQVGTLAAGVAHEINNPLAYVVANLSFLAEELPALMAELGERRNGDEPRTEAPSRRPPSLEDVEQTLAEAREGAERVRLIVQELKTFSRPADDDNEAIDVRDVLDSTCNIAWNEIRHRARLVKSYGDVPLVFGNASRLGQVFLNLLVNAAQALSEGEPTKNEIRVTAHASEDGSALIEVKDTGCGIPRQQLRRIFDPFYTMKPVGVGTGLGLSICLTIVRALGGEISVESEVGQGSTFRVTLPAHRLSSAKPAATSFAPGLPRPRRACILIIDDEPAVAASLRRALGREHQISIASDALQARALLLTEHFDIVLCDVYMPATSGIDLYDEMVRDRPEVAERFLFMSGGVDGATRMRLQATARDVIDKPFALSDLRAVIASRLDANGIDR